jgi:hypothetical protein
MQLLALTMLQLDQRATRLFGALDCVQRATFVPLAPNIQFLANLVLIKIKLAKHPVYHVPREFTAQVLV